MPASPSARNVNLLAYNNQSNLQSRVYRPNPRSSFVNHFSGALTPKLLTFNSPEKKSKVQFSLVMYEGYKLTYAKIKL